MEGLVFYGSLSSVDCHFDTQLSLMPCLLYGGALSRKRKRAEMTEIKKQILQKEND